MIRRSDVGRYLRCFCTPLILVVAFVCASIAPVFAAGGVTGSLRGTVVDQTTGTAVAGATVVAASPSGSFRAATDDRGFFSFLQLPTDTYTVSIDRNGFAPTTFSGVTILGDQSQNLGPVKLAKTLKTIGSTRNANRTQSAFQPNQTVDETTFSGARVDQALGEKGSTNYNQLVLSAPGVIPTAEGSNSPISIRGSASVEIGYQFDGVDFRGSFFDENPNQGFLNGVGGGRGAVQVVSGAGDASQGGIGAGVVNVIPGRGTYPGDGFASFDTSGPYFNHAFAFQYGIGSKDGRFSEFFSARSERSAPQIAPYGRDAADASLFSNAYRGTSYTLDDDVLNNFYYRFGKNNNQQVQVLADFIDHRAYAQYGGLANTNYYPYDPFSYSQFAADNSGNPMWPTTTADPTGLNWYQSVIPYLPGVPKHYAPVTQPEEFIYGPTDFLKIGYSRPLGSATALNAFFYNWGGLVANNITGNSSDLTTGSNLPGYNNAGGRKVGFQTTLTTQAGQHHTVSLVYKFENGFPYWVQQNHGNTWQGFIGGRSTDQTNFAGGQNLPTYDPLSGVGYANGARIEDWFLPQNLGQPVSAANPCVGPAIDNNFASGAPTTSGCYLYSWLLAHGKWTGRLPAVPTTGFNYNNTDFQQWGLGLRDQWSPSDRLHIDYGVRVDTQNLRWNGSSLNKDLSNTADIGLGYAQLSNSYLHPQVFQPRLSIDQELGKNDSVRAGYGRSASFFFGQTGGTPTDIANVAPILYSIPAKDSATINTNPAAGPVTLGPACGSGWHGPGKNANGTYVQSPYVYFSGQGVLNQNGYYFQCPNYAASVYWAFDQAYAAPDIGGQTVATYNNWDVAYAHQFASGWGARLTSYVRRGYNTYQTSILNAGPPDPVTGQQNTGSFQERQTGVQKALGVEFLLTTPDRAFGFSGFASANYLNELTTTPPVSGSDSLPAVAQYLNDSGLLFHQTFLPPFSMHVGLQYKLRNGLKINPIWTLDGGEPFGVGSSTLGFVNGVLYTLPTGNLGVATPYAGPGQPNQPYNATCYVDPAYPGSYLNPKDFACRGYAEPALAGGKFTRPRLYTDLDIEYAFKRYTVGAYISNLLDNYRGQPRVNQAWQPVATGVGGVQTGQFANAYPILQDGTTNPLYSDGGRNMSVYDEYWLPFQRLYEVGRTYRVYFQIAL